MLHQVRLDRFEEWFIRCKARQLAGRAGFTISDVEDIEQDIRLDILQRLPQHDPVKSNRHTFVVMLVRRCVASLLEARRAPSRNGGRQLQSLNAVTADHDGQRVELQTMLTTDFRRPRLGAPERRDLVADVRRAVAALPADLRPWCEVLGQTPIDRTARDFRIPRSRLRRIREAIRTAFEEAGLAAYTCET